MKLKKNVRVFYFLFTLYIPQFFSCTPIDVFEKNITVPNYKWQSHFVAKGSFEIKDSSVSYKIYLILRHTDFYKYNNIWLNIGIQPPADSMHNQKFDIQLATDAEGWRGVGMNDIWEVRELLSEQPLKLGLYNFAISNIMRDNPLWGIMSIGLRVEKSKQ